MLHYVVEAENRARGFKGKETAVGREETPGEGGGERGKGGGEQRGLQARAAGAAASLVVEEAADRLCALEGDDEEDEDVMDGANSLRRLRGLPR